MKRAGTIREVLLDAVAMRQAVVRMAAEITARIPHERLALVGIQAGGVVLARRLRDEIAGMPGAVKPKFGTPKFGTPKFGTPKFGTPKFGTPKFGTIDITLYRDDLAQATHFPEIKATDILFDVDGAEIVLVDDVLYTGRTIRAALDNLMDLGRPRAVRLAVLMDRGGRELPIAADFIGRAVQAQPRQSVTVQLVEEDGIDQVVLEDLP